jgi:hypothetical protein
MRTLARLLYRFRAALLGGAIVALVTGMAVALTARDSSDGPADTSRLQAVPATCRTDTGLPEDAEVLAMELLSGTGGMLVIDESRLGRTTNAISEVLAAIYASHPGLAAIRAFPEYQSGAVIVRVQREMVAGIELPDILDRPEPAPQVNMITGTDEFDGLNSELGLSGVEAATRDRGESRSLMLCFEEPVNVPAAAAAYREVDGVLDAEPNGYGGDGPDVGVERVGETWYVVFRDASGDCPAGCINETLYYYKVDGDRNVEAVGGVEAEQDARFVGLAESLGFNSAEE